MKNATTLALTLALVICSGLACSTLKGIGSNTATANTNTTSNAATANTDPINTGSNSSSTAPKAEKADFTMSSEEYDAEFYKKGVKSADLEKYAKKVIQVSGRVSMLVTEKKGTTQPWVTLYAPGVLRGVSCYFDDADVDQMKKLKEDKNATVQGIQGNLLVPQVSPMLDHCTVISGS